KASLPSCSEMLRKLLLPPCSRIPRSLRASGLISDADLYSPIGGLTADVRRSKQRAILVVLTAPWGWGQALSRPGFACQTETSQRHPGEADAKLFQRCAARERLGHLFG